ncbi:MAG: phosphoethanolamine transferase [Prevotella sp.]|nr:phosphoethanolamine transferase [Prevotella sp.]
MSDFLRRLFRGFAERSKRVLEQVSIPFVSHLPFIAAYLCLMGLVEVLQCIHGRMVTYDASVTVLDYVEQILLWFLLSYLLATLFSLKHFRWTRWVVCPTVVVLVVVQSFLLSNFGTRITPTILTMIAETNDREASDFFRVYLLSKPSIALYARAAVFALAFALLSYFYQKARRRWQVDRSWLVGMALLPVLAGGLHGLRFYRSLLTEGSADAVRIKLGHEGPQDAITFFLKSLSLMNRTSEEMHLAVEASLDVTVPQVSRADSVTIVLVVGESYIKHHAEIYGYPLATTPHMAGERQRGNLFVYSDVVTPYNSTSRVIKNLLSCNSIGNGENWYEYPFLPTLFRQAGYRVVLWDNQRNFAPNEAYSFTLNSFLYDKELSERSYSLTNTESFEFDGPFIDLYRQQETSANEARNLVIFHLQGQHVDASSHFPHTPEYEHFTADSIRRPDAWLTKEHRKHIADYDNATRYNDDVLYSIMNLFRDTPCVLVYLSDHGDEVYDYREQFGREHNPHITCEVARYEFEIPFVVWCSDAYMSRYPAMTEKIKQAADRPLMSDNLCQMLLFLGGIEADCYREDRNVLSSSYVCPPRIIHDCVDYDKLMSE